VSSRIARLVFGTLPAQSADFAEACLAEVPPSVSTAEPCLLTRLRHKLQSDEALAQLLQDGNADALTVLFERHSALLFGISRRILRNDAEAEDVVQQIFLDVFRSIQQFNPGRGSFKTWLLMFAYQRAFNSRRSLAANRFLDSDPIDEQLPELSANRNSSPRYSLAEATVLVNQVLRELRPRQRRTIELIYYEGLTADEVAARTGETVRVVRHNLYRGLERLRTAVAKGAPK
jgi:RNA polymerase sigma-70 factor (ECF subfamily)